ncbi:SDR family NAD(P)-dependent oxidoreductase [Capillimicrobium parvum]|uniref:Pyridoxal 4-dehydrogenase n=1 Tax=Capillimicrobium parvum TaxID=2884022 RepID=A0A9E7C1D3_9ACTN|nr:SDR family NAD(P)-dependent oxidoreductase [Capillimicrobium parvum]UGS37291.1 Pyridoxal 4-dehydrogenase [Capillimicrobium parvum]
MQPTTAHDAYARPFQGQVGIVTGAARGIGRAVARRLAADGMRVVVWDLDGDGAEQAAAELRSAGADAQAFALDVTDEAAVTAAAQAVRGELGRIDALVNNAGIYPHVPFVDLTLEDWRRIMRVNTESAFLCSKAVFPAMRDQRYGRIVNFASAVFLNGVGGPAYVASKAAAIGLTRSSARELAEHGITVNAVAPGLIDTEGLRDLGPRADELFGFVVPSQLIRRRGRPEDIAECVAFLVAPANGFMTGQLVNVDGGDSFH